jgi:hypothetical protein
MIHDQSSCKRVNNNSLLVHRLSLRATAATRLRALIPPKLIRAMIYSVFTLLADSGVALAQSGNADFLLFASGEIANRQGISSDNFAESAFTPAADLLFTYTKGPWRVLGEYYLTDEENELERLQLGYDVNEESTAWIGRFHQPISAWNFAYHHGGYLTPSITRPAIENWEDEHGVLPAHATGFLIESGIRRGGGGGFHLNASAGFGPTILDSSLHPFDLTDPDPANGGLAVSFSIAYHPDFVGSTNFGLMGGITDLVVLPSLIPGNVVPFDIRQTTFGAQANWQNKSWQVIAAAYYVNNRPEAPYTAFGGSFLPAYVQLIKQLNESSNVYFRLEDGINTRSAGYLKLFPEFVTNRILVGGRVDFSQNQAIALELAGVETVRDHFTEVRLQWSGVFQ